MEHLDHCPVCEHDEIPQVTDRGKDFDKQAIRCCLRCGLFFQSPRFDAEELAEYYGSEYSQQYRGSEVPDAEALARRDAIAAYRVQRLRELEVLESGQTLFEVGCGAGNFLAACRAEGIVTAGVEPSRGYAGFARSQGLDVRTGSFPEQSGPRAEYDVVALFHVLEHLADPVAVLKELRSLLPEDGRLVVEVPDLSRAVGPRWSENYFHAPHLVDFSEPSLETALGHAGFAVVHRDYCASQKRRGHHLLVVAEPAPITTATPEPGVVQELLGRVRRWIAVSRVTRPLTAPVRALLRSS